MKWLPTSIGAEPKKLILLAVLLAAVPAVYVYNSQPEIPSGAPSRPAQAVNPSVNVPAPQPRPAARRAAPPARINEDFRPTLNLPEDFDLSSIDPTLKLDLLARVRAVEDAGGGRSLFEFYTPPPPPPKVDPIKPAPPKPAEAAKPAPPPVIPVKPPPPPIPLKFYGYAGTPRDGKLRGLFVDGEETFVVTAGETIRNRYKIARIGVETAEVEDLTAKSTQTLRIVPKCDDKEDRCR